MRLSITTSTMASSLRLPLFLLACLFAFSSTTQGVPLGSKILLVDQSPTTPSALFAQEVMAGIGIPSETVSLDVGCTLPATTQLTTVLNDVNQNQYYAIIVTHTNLKVFVANACQQLAVAIQNYQVRNGARVARLGAAPLVTEAPFFYSPLERSVDGNGNLVPNTLMSAFSVVNGTSTEEFITLTPFARRMLAGSLFRKSGVRADLALSTVGVNIQLYPVQAVDTVPPSSWFTMNPLIVFREPSFPKDTILAAIEYWNVPGSTSKREEMAFYFAQPNWSTISQGLHPIWLIWLTRGLFLGDRRVMLGTQIDDVLLNTPFDHAADGLSKYSNYTKNGGGAGYDLSNPTIVALLKQYNSNANTGYRFTPADVGRLVAWRNKMLSVFPAGSDYTIELAVNGHGSMEAMLSKCNTIPACSTNPNSPSCTLGTLTPSLYASLDPTFQAVQQHVRDFYWVSHTYSHLSLTCDDQTNLLDTDCNKVGGVNTHFNKSTTYAQVAAEAMNNVNFLENMLLGPVLGADLPLFYSRHSMVTPGISGTYSTNALSALYDSGITNIVGDNTRDAALNHTLYDQYLTQDWICSDAPIEQWKHQIDDLVPENPYEAYYTTAATNGFGTGTPVSSTTVVPRWGTNVYYDASQEVEDSALYGFIYKTPSFVPFDQIITAQAKITATHLMAYRHDPNMFHQANLRFFPWSSAKGLWPLSSPIQEGSITYTCLVCLFVEYVWAEYGRAFELPLITLRQDDMAALLTERYYRNRCGVQISFDKNATGFINSATVTTAADCVVPLSGVMPAASTPSSLIPASQLNADGSPVLAVGNDRLHRQVYGPDRTAYLNMKANNPVTLLFEDPVQFFTPRLNSNASCTITLPVCPKYPYMAGTFQDVFGEDNYQASLSANQCFARARAYLSDCQASLLDTAAAVFVSESGQAFRYNTSDITAISSTAQASSSLSLSSSASSSNLSSSASHSSSSAGANITSSSFSSSTISSPSSSISSSTPHSSSPSSSSGAESTPVTVPSVSSSASSSAVDQSSSLSSVSTSTPNSDASSSSTASTTETPTGSGTACPSNCAVCTTNGVCTSCNSGFTVANGQCIFNSTPVNPSSSSSNSPSAGVVVAAVAGGLVVLAALSAIILVLVRRRRARAGYSAPRGSVDESAPFMDAGVQNRPIVA